MNGSAVRTMTLEEFRECLRSQDVPLEQAKFKCVKCGTVQCAQDFIDKGIGNNFQEVQHYLGFSCIGRFTEDKGCDWTLGGLFQIHKLEIIDDDGINHPHFEPVGGNYDD